MFTVCIGAPALLSNTCDSIGLFTGQLPSAYIYLIYWINAALSKVHAEVRALYPFLWTGANPASIPPTAS